MPRYQRTGSPECPLSQWAHRLCVNDPVSGLMSGLRPHPFPGGLGAVLQLWGWWGRWPVPWTESWCSGSLGNLGQLCPGPRSPLSPMHHHRMMGAGGLPPPGVPFSAGRAGWSCHTSPSPGVPLKDPVTATRGEGTHVWMVLCTEALVNDTVIGNPVTMWAAVRLGAVPREAFVTGQHQPPCTLLAVAPLSSSDPGAQRFLEKLLRSQGEGSCSLCLQMSGQRFWPPRGQETHNQPGPQPPVTLYSIPTD